MNQKHLYFLVFTVNKFRLNQLMELIFSPLEKLQKNRITSPFSLLIFISLSGSPASACKRNAWRILSFWITRFGEKLKTMHFQQVSGKLLLLLLLLQQPHFEKSWLFCDKPKVSVQCLSLNDKKSREIRISHLHQLTHKLESRLLGEI